MFKTATLVAALGTLLTGCVTNDTFATLGSSDPASADAGACSAFPRPEYQIRGATPFDQKWADVVTEVGVAGCKWERPMPRPAAMDVPRFDPRCNTAARYDAMKDGANCSASEVTAKPKKITIWSRVKAKLKKKPAPVS